MESTDLGMAKCLLRPRDSRLKYFHFKHRDFHISGITNFFFFFKLRHDFEILIAFASPSVNSFFFSLFFLEVTKFFIFE